jgi:hypothetical protein
LSHSKQKKAPECWLTHVLWQGDGDGRVGRRRLGKSADCFGSRWKGNARGVAYGQGGQNLFLEIMRVEFLIDDHDLDDVPRTIACGAARLL